MDGPAGKFGGARLVEGMGSPTKVFRPLRGMAAFASLADIDERGYIPGKKRAPSEMQRFTVREALVFVVLFKLQYVLDY